MIAVITGVVTVGGVEYPVQTQIELPDPVRQSPKRKKK